MLNKLCQIPLKVIFSATFLVAITATAVWLIPPLAITMLVVITSVYSFITLYNYWESCQ